MDSYGEEGLRTPMEKRAYRLLWRRGLMDSYGEEGLWTPMEKRAYGLLRAYRLLWRRSCVLSSPYEGTVVYVHVQLTVVMGILSEVV